MRKPTQLLSATLVLCLLLSLTPMPQAAETPTHSPEAQPSVPPVEEDILLSSEGGTTFLPEDTEELSTQASGAVAYSGYCGAEGDGTNVFWV